MSGSTACHFALLKSLLEDIKELFLIEPYLDSLEGISYYEELMFLSKKADSEINPFIRKLVDFNVSLKALEDEALKITGNSPVHGGIWDADEIFAGLGRLRRFSRWTPRGKITFQDDLLGVQPVVGVRIRYGRWYSFRTVRTNSRGEFSGRRRRTRARYKIEWRANDFKLQRHRSIRKSYSKSAWNKHLTGKDALCAVVWVAAREYFYGNIDGLSRPRKKLSRLGIKVRDKSNKNRQAYFYGGYIGQSIGVYLKMYNNNDRYLSTAGAYLAAIHELAHNAHYRNFENPTLVERTTVWRDMQLILKESFARGMEWHFGVKRYGQNRLPRSFVYFKDYTGIVEDLIDTDEGYAFGGAWTPSELRNKTELVSGFTIKQIENTVFKSICWDDFRYNLKKIYPPRSGGPSYTATEIDDLFANWGSL